MKAWKKIMGGASVALLSAVIASGVDADAATFTVDKHMGGITSGDMVSYDAVKDKGGTLTWNAKAKWDTYYGTVDYVDITNVKTAKDAYITVKTSAGYTVYKIEKDTVTKYKGKITGTDLAITEGTTELDKTNAKWANYQYRTESGAWENLTANQDLKLAPYEQQGATLYFRYKGAASVTATADSSLKVDGAPTGTTVNKIAANSFAGKEFKVKVPKMANAPAIAIDYNTGAVKAKKGAEYRQGTTFSDATTGWKDFDANYAIDSSTAGTFQMRTKATDKKAASKIAVYSWSAITAPTVTANTVAAAEGTLITNELTYKSAEVTDLNKATFEIANKTSDKTYVLYKVKTEGGKTVADGKAVATIKPNKSVVLKNSKVPKDTELAVQIAGDKKTDVLPSGFSTAKVKVIYNVKTS